MRKNGLFLKTSKNNTSKSLKQIYLGVISEPETMNTLKN